MFTVTPSFRRSQPEVNPTVHRKAARRPLRAAFLLTTGAQAGCQRSNRDVCAPVKVCFTLTINPRAFIDIKG
jgi:hypothetical protein